MKNNIEFNGMITGKAKKFYYKRLSLYWICSITCMWLGMTVILQIGFAIMYGGYIDLDWYGYLLWIAIFLIIFCALALIVLFIKKYNLKKFSFDYKNFYIVKDKRIYVVPISGIKQIVDYGEFYQIKLSSISRLTTDFNIYIFQKELITKGTLEEFEAMFDDKIKRS